MPTQLPGRARKASAGTSSEPFVSTRLPNVRAVPLRDVASSLSAVHGVPLSAFQSVSAFASAFASG